MTTPETSQCVLVVGDDALCAALVARLQSLAPLPPASSSHAAPGHDRIRISNKYYEADVALVTCAPGALRATLRAVLRAHAIEGIILAVTRGSVDVARALAELHAVEEGPDIRLLAVHTPAPVAGAAHDSWDAGARTACVDHCVELCAIDADSVARDDAFYAADDAEGARRILDALGAHIWPHMRRAQAERAASPSAEPLLAEAGAAAAGERHSHCAAGGERQHSRRASEAERLEAGEAILEEMQAFQRAAGALDRAARAEGATALMERFAAMMGPEDLSEGDSGDDASDSDYAPSSDDGSSSGGSSGSGSSSDCGSSSGGGSDSGLEAANDGVSSSGSGSGSGSDGGRDEEEGDGVEQQQHAAAGALGAAAGLLAATAASRAGQTTQDAADAVLEGAPGEDGRTAGGTQAAVDGRIAHGARLTAPAPQSTAQVVPG